MLFIIAPAAASHDITDVLGAPTTEGNAMILLAEKTIGIAHEGLAAIETKGFLAFYLFKPLGSCVISGRCLFHDFAGIPSPLGVPFAATTPAQFGR